MSTSHRLLSRLYGDLLELRDAPYPGVSVFADDANIRKLCLVLTPPSGAWKDLSLHFDVEIPDNWPASPPKIRSSVTGIEHPNLFGNYICCDLLKKHRGVYFRDEYDGGYTPALTLSGLFLQFLTFFSSTKIEQEDGYAVTVGDHVIREFVLEKHLEDVIENIKYASPHIAQYADIQQDELASQWDSDQSLEFELGRYQDVNGVVIHKTKQQAPHSQRIHLLETENQRRKQTMETLERIGFKCSSCPYGSSELPYHANDGGPRDVEMRALKASLPAPPPSCALEILPDDCLYVIATHLPSQAVISFAEAYPRFRSVVDSNHELLRRELTCFFLRTSLRDSILGIGVALDARARFLSSDFDWLSEEAYAVYGVRLGIRKKPFEYFLPLAFNRYHFQKAEPLIWRSLRKIDAALREAELSTVKTGRGTSKPVNALSNAPGSKHEAIRVVFQMMNNVVVSLMKSCDDVLASSSSSHSHLLRTSERAVYAYCHLFHLAICLSRTTPAFRDAEAKIRNFAKKSESEKQKSGPRYW